MKLRIISFVLICINFIALKANEIDTNNIMDQVYLAFNLQEKYPDSSLKIAHNVYSESKKKQFKEGIAYASLRIGTIFNLRANNDSALKYVKEAFQIRTELNDYIGASSAGIYLGIIYKEKGRLDSAFSYLIKSEKLAYQSKDNVAIQRVSLEIAHLFMDYGDTKKAFPRYKKAVEISFSLENNELIAYSFTGLAKYFFEVNEFDSSLVYYKKSVEFFEDLDFPQQVLVNKNNIGLCLSSLHEFKEATNILKSTIDGYKSYHLMEDLSVLYLNLGNVYIKRSMPDSAIYFLNQSSSISKIDENLENESLAYYYLSNAYKSKGDYQSAHHFQLKYAVVKDSILSLEKIRSISEMQTKYETELKEREIQILDGENKTKTVQRNFLIAVILVLLLSTVGIIYHYIQKNRIAKQNEKIAQQRMESILDEQEIKTYNAMLEGQEEERMRIANDLHDRLGSMLSTIKLMFGSIEEKIDKVQEVNLKQYDKANSLIDEACVEVRRISHNLGSGMVANYGLTHSLEDLCDTVTHSGKINCRLLSYNMEEGLPLKYEVGLYRITQELINNALKHAEAKQISIQLNRLDNELSLIIEDDGKGFDVESKLKSEGMGLESIKKRAEKINGTLFIDSKPGKGTTTIIEIPLI